jgi:5-methylcytosine-specific restriction protein B
MAADLRVAVRTILEILREKKNVLISGPPGTGKSKLLSDLKFAFEQTPPAGGAAAAPVHDRGAKIPIPETPPQMPPEELQNILPSPAKTNRRVFPTAFHQGTKFRDFVTGVVPVVKTAVNTNAIGFRVMTGTLYQAAEFAKQPDSAALVIIDEINRGPAIQIFGGSIVAIEADKRLAEDGSKRRETQFFDVIDPASGDLLPYALPHDLYIVAAMNQADASVEPLDVAFLRRFVPYALEPDAVVLRLYYGRPSNPVPTPDAPGDEGDVYEAAIQAWQAVNSRIRLGRGSAFQIGHGILMNGDVPIPTGVDRALFSVAQSWKAIRAHIDEVFFGDMGAIAETLNVDSKPHLYSLSDVLFAGEPRIDLVGPETVGVNDIYALLRAVAR